MNVHDDSMLDSVAVYALGAIPPSEAKAVREHIDSCATCREEYRQLLPAVTAVGYSAEACADGTQGAMASQFLKARIMKAVRAEGRAKTAAAVDGAASAMRRSRPIVWPAYAVAAACILIALSTSIANISLNEEVKQSQAQVAQGSARAISLSRGLQQQRMMLADLVAGDSVRYPVPNGQVIRHGNRLYIALASAPMPPKGKVYQAWMLHDGAKTMVPSVTFMPNRHGVAVISLPANASALAAVAVSIEPDGGSKQPTSKPTFVVKLD